MNSLTRRIVPIVLIPIVLILTGCGGANTLGGSSWPGVTLTDKSVYLAYSQRVYAIDPTDGKLQWVYPTDSSSMVFYATPVLDDNLLVAANYNGSVFGLNPTDGTKKWEFHINNARFVGGATLSKKLVYAAAADGTVYALNRTDGTQVWAFTAEAGVWSAPLLADGVLYVTSLDKHVYALDPATGQVEWKFPDAGQTLDPAMGAIAGTPTFVDGMLYFGSFNNHVYALDTTSHRQKWEYNTSNWVWSSPAYDTETGLLVGGDLDGHVFALNAKTGEEKWSYDAKSPVVSTPTIVRPADGEPIVYVTAGGDPNLFTLSLEKGTEVVPPASIRVDFETSFLWMKTGVDTRSVPLYGAVTVRGDSILIPIQAAQPNVRPLQAFASADLKQQWGFDPTSYQPPAAPASSGGIFSNPTTLNLLLIVMGVVLLVTLLTSKPRGK